MTTPRGARGSLTSWLALVLVLGGTFAALLAWARATQSAEDCGARADGACAEGAPDPLGAGDESGGDPVPRLDSATACRDAAYLCADVDKAGQIQIQRWRHFEGTMIVHVPLPGIADVAQAQRLQHAATAGIRRWNGQPFPILVDERGTRHAQIEVRWVPSLAGSQIGVAHVAWTATGGLSVRSIELVTQNPLNGRDVDPDEMLLTAMHEMGHALGLPHSEDPHDVMYSTNAANGLSARDYKAIEALYRLPDGALIIP